MDHAIALISQLSTRKNLPEFSSGQTVRVHQIIREGDKERVQVYEGMIISVNRGTGVNASITVRKVVDGIGVERLFPIHSPLISKISITRKAKVRRSKLYYMRDLSGKSARLKTTMLEEQTYDLTKKDEPAVEEPVGESPSAEVATEPTPEQVS